MMRTLTAVVAASILVPVVLLARPAAQSTVPSAASCERLASLSLPNTTITLAQVVAAVKASNGKMLPDIEGDFVVKGRGPR